MKVKSFVKTINITFIVLFLLILAGGYNNVFADGSVFYGNVDGNETVTLRDALYVLKYIADQEELSTSQYKAADVDGNGFVNIEDVNQIFDKATGTIDSMPMEEDVGNNIAVPLELVEDDSTVVEGVSLRASTYRIIKSVPFARNISLLADDSDTTDVEEIKYFPVTMFNYDKDTINSAMNKYEYENNSSLTKWEGIYFGNPTSSSFTAGYTIPSFDENGMAEIEDGEYYIIHIRSGKYLTSTISNSGFSGTEEKTEATLWTISKTTSGYTISNNGGYISVGNGTASLSTDSNEINLIQFADSDGVLIGESGYYLNQYGGASSNLFKGYSDASDNGSSFYLVKKDDTLVQVGPFSYDENNAWHRNQLYGGMAASQLDANKNIVFNYPDCGIFSTDNSFKDIYTNVNLPFEYNDGTYTFDSSEMGAVFDGEPSSNTTLKYLESPQTNNTGYADGSSTVWLPYNDSTNINGEASCDYYFGMVATIPFSMTNNGRINPNDDSSEPITFSFSGDDDIWIFIDGQLVLDVGGIHNRLDATIDFAANTWSIYKSDMNTSSDTFGSYDDRSEISGTVFNTESDYGILNQTIESFAATSTHELTIFYLERGAGSSNAKIQFNLPMKDVVSVTKDATKSITEDGTIYPLTSSEQAVIDQIDFGFTLYKDGSPLANTDFSLLNANGQVISTPSTDSTGHFYLKNGQTARFIVEIEDEELDGSSYQVVEDLVSDKGFILTEFSYSGTAAHGYVYSDNSYTTAGDIEKDSGTLSSKNITAIGTDEYEDSLNFHCYNYLDANLPNPTCITVDDTIVIDYGLPVLIPVLHNDIYRGDKIEITEVAGAKYGTVTIEEEKIKYQLDQPLSSVEVLEYTAKVTGSSVGVDGEVSTATESTTAKLYIIPATGMYYEEDFGSLVTYTGNWTEVGNAKGDFQETGFVGTVDDSPYGSDACYITDSGDSYGKSMYVDTTNNVAGFSYTFTGTGTSFFARTSNNSGYIKIDIFDSDNTKVYSWMRDTMYKSDSPSILYNIPVFTWNAEAYGTYRVEVSIAKKFLSYGTEFWLDGIRVYSPLNPNDVNNSIADAAYLTDMEANCAVETLRDKLITDATQTDESGNLVWSEQDQENGYFVVFTDTNGAIIDASEYVSNGPKEEVYLNSGQNVTFSLTKWNSTSNRIFLGIKAPAGGGSVSINNNVLSIQNTTDCYYDITSYANLTTDADGVVTATFNIKAVDSLISVTNIKVSGQFEFAIINNTN